MIDALTVESFVEILQQQLSPTAPIQSEEHLHGREMQLRDVKQALYATGRSIFIHGDRGVGKTSLAQTVAFENQSAYHDPVLLACTPDSTFGGVIRDVVRALLTSMNTAGSTTRTRKINTGALAYEITTSTPSSAAAPTEPLELNAAIALLQKAAERRSGQTVVVLDEFDRITDSQERVRFGDFIKQIGDQRLPIRFVFCGVADSLEKLLGTHDSAFRYIVGVELPRLSWDARWAIIDSAAAALNVSIGDHPRFRIAAISDGFPHYVHLVCEKLFWEMFNDPARCIAPSPVHYRNAVAAAVMGIEQHLKKAYEKATLKDTTDNEEVLWAVADHSELIRHKDSICTSYERISQELVIDPPMDRAEVSASLQALKGPGCGRILASNRRGWYHFRENIVRGYVRLRAEEQGLELALDYSPGVAMTRDWGQRGITQKSRRASKRFRSKG